MPEKDAKEYLSRMECYTPWARIIGQVSDKKDYSIIVR
jgi:selenide,water dikinase